MKHLQPVSRGPTKGAFLFAAVFVFAQAACAAPNDVGSGISSSVRLDGRPQVSQRGPLPAGVYYASFHPDENTVRYYALTNSTATYVGRALVEAAPCHLSATHTLFSVDMQRQFDIAATCGSRDGFLQIPAGRTGLVRPARNIVTRFSNDAILEASVDRNGDVAIGKNALESSESDINTVFLYGPEAVGDGKPASELHVFTRACSSSVRKGPGTLIGSPRSGINFDGLGRLVMYVGPPPGWSCGYQYIERFDAKNGELLNWLMPGLLKRFARGQTPFDVNPTAFVAMGNSDLIFSAFTNRSGVFAANAGGAKYAPSAVNLQPPPESFFTDSTHSGLPSDDTEAVPIGYDRDGGVYIQSNVGGSTVARFGPHANGNARPSEIIHVPQEELYYPSVIFDNRQ